MEEAVLADKYAKALVSCAEDAQTIERIDKELAQLEEFFAQKPLLREIFQHPAISLQEKNDLLASILKGMRISSELKSFLSVLLDERRINLLKEIIRLYRDLVYALGKKMKVFVESASSLRATEKEALRRRLAKIYQHHIDLIVHVNPQLIGGLKLYVGHKLYDGTVRTRLNLLKSAIESSQV